MTPLTRTAASAAVAALLTAWTTVDLAAALNWGTTAAVWGILTAVITGGWAVIDAETRGES